MVAVTARAQSAADVLLDSLDAILEGERPCMVEVPGAGAVVIYPGERAYVGDVRDWDQFGLSAGDPPRWRPVVWQHPPGAARTVDELRWLLAYQAARGASQGGHPHQHELLSLKAWPDLQALPDTLFEPVTRVCGLLWRKPTVGHLVGRILGLGHDEAATVVGCLGRMGALHVSTPFGAASGLEAQADADARPAAARGDAGRPRDKADAPAALADSLFARIWKRLLPGGVAA